jgi:acetyl-CoA acetyltransferase
MAPRGDGEWGAARPVEDVGGQVAIVGVGESDHTKASGRTAKEITVQAIERALDDAGLRARDIDGIMWIGTADGFTDVDFREHFGVTHEMWTSSQGGGMRWAATAPALAARAIREGEATHVLNTFAVAWATQRDQMVGGPGQSHARELFKQNLEVPMGWFPQPVYFATIARRHVHEFATPPEAFGRIAVTCRTHANRTPAAVMHDKALTLDDYLAQPMLVEPFRKEDCCLISDGGGAYIVTSRERAADLRPPVVEVGGVGLGVSHTGPHWSQQAAFTSTPHVFAGPGAFAMAGVTPADVDVFTCYDPFTIVTLMTLEDLGFCPKGEVGAFVAEHDLLNDTPGLAVQTHGGLLSHAYVLGIAHVVEVVRQLRGEAAAQKPRAEIGIYGGYTGPEASVLVLRRAR